MSSFVPIPAADRWTLNSTKPVSESTAVARRCYAAVIVSGAVHCLLILILGRLAFVSRSKPLEVTRINTRWTRSAAEASQDSLHRIDVTPADRHADSVDSAQITIARSVPSMPRVSPSLMASSHPNNLAAAWLTDAAFPNQAEARRFGMPFGDAGNVDSASDGTNGAGNGDGAGGGFFKVAAEGKRIVFVLDGSRSMNHPHPSAAKTRFRRVKLELLKSIASMTRDMEFFIIFFNNTTIPMPAPGLQPAIPELQNRFLYWMQSVRAEGETEPTAALALALRMRPDAIYFLTDGDFIPRVRKELLALPRTGSVVHTFAFAESMTEEVRQAVDVLKTHEIREARRMLKSRDYHDALILVQADDLLKTIAHKHGGEYHVIP